MVKAVETAQTVKSLKLLKRLLQNYQNCQNVSNSKTLEMAKAAQEAKNAQIVISIISFGLAVNIKIKTPFCTARPTYAIPRASMVFILHNFCESCVHLAKPILRKENQQIGCGIKLLLNKKPRDCYYTHVFTKLSLLVRTPFIAYKSA